jgi:hypothetical protein
MSRARKSIGKTGQSEIIWLGVCSIHGNRKELIQERE